MVWFVFWLLVAFAALIAATKGSADVGTAGVAVVGVVEAGVVVLVRVGVTG